MSPSGAAPRYLSSMKSKYPRFFSITGLLLLAAGSAQAQAASPWPITQLDSIASVRMPYGGTIDETYAAQGLIAFSTTTSDNGFDAIIFTPQSERALKPGQVLVPVPDKLLASLMKLPDNSFTRPKLKSSFPVTVPSAPTGQGVHQVYSGFDAFHQSEATMELTWVVVGTTMYVFRCSAQLPEAAGAAEDMKHFFTTIEFKQPRP